MALEELIVRTQVGMHLFVRQRCLVTVIDSLRSLLKQKDFERCDLAVATLTVAGEHLRGDVGDLVQARNTVSDHLGDCDCLGNGVSKAGNGDLVHIGVRKHLEDVLDVDVCLGSILEPDEGLVGLSDFNHGRFNYRSKCDLNKIRHRSITTDRAQLCD